MKYLNPYLLIATVACFAMPNLWGASTTVKAPLPPNVTIVRDGCAGTCDGVYMTGGAGDYDEKFRVAIGNTLFYRGFDAAHGWEIWRTDGTAAGTRLVSDVRPGTASSNPIYFTKVGSSLYFVTYDAHPNNPNWVYGANFQLWKSDGTATGTQLVISLGNLPFLLYRQNGYPVHAYDLEFAAVGNQLVFAANVDNSDPFVGGIGFEVYATDGTANGTRLVRDIHLGGSSLPAGFTLFNGRLFFTAWTPATGMELWSTDGSAARTVLVADIAPGATNGLVSFEPREFQGRLYFSGCASSNLIGGVWIPDCELFATDGTTNGTQIVRDIDPGVNPSNPTELTVFNNRLFFAASTVNEGRELWVSDGTTQGTQIFSDMTLGVNSTTPNQLTVAGGKLYFVFSQFTPWDPTSHGTELFVTDGTIGGTRLVKDIWSGSTGAFPWNLTAFGNQIAFFADSGRRNKRLFVSDGTVSGTLQLPTENLVDSGNWANRPIVIGTQLLFMNQTSTQGWEWWKVQR